MSISVYFNFDGQCKEAAEYYAKIFSAQPPKLLMFSDLPDNGTNPPMEEWAGQRVLHGEVQLKDTVLMFSDIMPGMKLDIGNQITLMYASTDKEEIDRIFHELAMDGTIMMEMQETFFSKWYGSVMDKFKTVWQLNLQKDEAE